MFVSITASAAARLAAEFYLEDAAYWAGLSAACWVVAFGLFLFTFRRELRT